MSRTYRSANDTFSDEKRVGHRRLRLSGMTTDMVAKYTAELEEAFWLQITAMAADRLRELVDRETAKHVLSGDYVDHEGKSDFSVG